MNPIPFAGEFAALATALCWTFTSMAFESAGKRVGSLQVNLIRLVIAFFFLGTLSYFVNGNFMPVGASLDAWFWLLLSGVAGFVIGDLLLFQAFVVIGSRLVMVIMTTAPIFAAFISQIILGETLSPMAFAGMFVTISGIMFVLSGKKKKDEDSKVRKYGVLLALGGSFGQALGLVLSKYGMKNYSAISSTQIRVIAGIIGFSILFTILRRWDRIFTSLSNIPAMKRITTGAFFGPFMGVTFSLIAVQYTKTGIAATLMATTPVMILIPTRILFKQKIGFREIAGAVTAFAGVALIFLNQVG
jgi:drug/metabolite transporter (DMT)-like permease